MSALLMQNLRGAYLILLAIKQDGKSNKVAAPKGTLSYKYLEHECQLAFHKYRNTVLFGLFSISGVPK